METYQPETLKELQQVELSILKKFDSVCRKHNLQYFLVWGSMLGALRHRGFIPWDDDIDVGMMREDYEKLKAIPREEWDDEFKLVDPNEDSFWLRFPHPRLFKLNTVFESKYHWLHDRVKNNPERIMTPIWLDIFVLDQVKSPKTCYRRWPIIFLLCKMYYWSKCRDVPHKSDSTIRKIYILAKTCVFYLLNLVKSPELKCARKIEELCVTAPGEYVVDYYADHKQHLSPTKREDFFPLRAIQFEDLTTWIPKNAESLMTDRYGDFMSLPPEDQRVGHLPYILDLGDGRGKIVDMESNAER